MPGLFDDLIPQRQSAGGNMFSDLIPQSSPAPTNATIAPKGGVPRRATTADQPLTVQSSIFPISRNLETGSTSFDPNAGLLGIAQTPGKVASGEIDLNTPAGQRAAFNVSALMTPGALAAPGPLGAGPLRRALTPSAPSAPAASAASAARKRLVPDAPTTDDLQKLKTSLYNQADTEGVVLKPGPLGNFVEAVAKKIGRLDPDLQSDAIKTLSRFKTDLSGRLRLSELDNLRQVANDLRGSTKGSEKRVGAILVDAIDDLTEIMARNPNLVESSGNTAKTVATLRAARDANSRFRKSQVLDEVFERVEAKLEKNFRQADEATAIKQEFESLYQKLRKRNRPRICVALPRRTLKPSVVLPEEGTL